MNNSTLTATVELSEEQCAEVLRLSVLAYGTILVDDDFGQAWQIGRVKKVHPETLAFLGDVPVIQTIGSTDYYELALDSGPENDAMLLELLEGVTYKVVWPLSAE